MSFTKQKYMSYTLEQTIPVILENLKLQGKLYSKDFYSQMSLMGYRPRTVQRAISLLASKNKVIKKVNLQDTRSFWLYEG